MWLHKFIPQPCFDNAGAGGRSGGGVSSDRGIRGGIKAGGADRRDSEPSGVGLSANSGRGDIGGASRGGGGGSAVTRTALPPPAYTPPPAVVKTPTIAAPTLAQLTALTPKSYTAPVTAQNAAVYGPAAMMSMPSTASTLASAVAPVDKLASNRTNQALSRANMGPMDSPNTVSGSGYGSLADRAAIGTSGLGMGPGGVGGVAPGNASGFGAVSERNAGGGGNVGGGGMGANNDRGPSFSGGPQSNPASNAGNAVLGQSRSNVMGGFQDPSTNATGYSAAPGLLSRIGEANTAQNNSVLGRAVSAMGNLTGMAPIGLLANQAQIARDQFRTENPMARNPVAETTVNTGTLEPAEISTPVSEATLEAANQMRKDAIAEAASKAMAAEPGTMAQDRATELEKALAGNPDQQQTVTKGPFGGPDPNNPDLQDVLDKAIDFDAEPSANDFRTQMLRERIKANGQSPLGRSPLGYAGNARQVGARAAAQSQANSEAVQNAVKGLLNQQSQTTPASVPNAQPMPGSISENMSDISVVKRLRDNIRQGALGGAPTDTQGETAPSGKGLLDYSRNPPTIEWTGRAANDPEEQKISSDLKNVLNEALKVGVPIKIRSGYRNPSKNARVGGARGSTHMQGKAVDISLKGLSDAQRTALTVALINAGAKRVGAYSGNTGLHVDMRDMGGGSSHGDFHAMFDKTARNLDKAPSWFRDALQQASSGGDAIDAALNDQEAQAFLEQQGYSQTDEGKWTDGAQSFDNPIDAVKSLPLMDQLRAYIMWTRGGTPPPSRDDTNRGGGEWRPPGLLSASMGGPVTQPGNGNIGGGGPFVNGAGNWTPPGLLNRPYSNPWATRNPWLNV